MHLHLRLGEVSWKFLWRHKILAFRPLVILQILEIKLHIIIYDNSCFLKFLHCFSQYVCQWIFLVNGAMARTQIFFSVMNYECQINFLVFYLFLQRPIPGGVPVWDFYRTGDICNYTICITWKCNDDHWISNAFVDRAIAPEQLEERHRMNKKKQEQLKEEKQDYGLKKEEQCLLI